MTVARSTIVSLETTLWFLITVRAVRRSWLCGKDPVTGHDFEHRRGWIRDRIKQLCSIFAIDVASYAIMSNHYHAVVRVDRDRALQWTVDEVLHRWTQLFRGPPLVRRYLSEGRACMSEAEVAEVEALAETYRSRLYDLSWFMRTLNEFIARKANAEDGATGRFWEGRFKSQALLDEAALLAAMAYVDLNPVRAGIAETPEASAYTSIQERLEALAGHGQSGGDDGEGSRESAPGAAAAEPRVFPEAAITSTVSSLLNLRAEDDVHFLSAAHLLPFDASGKAAAVPFALADYLELVDWLGRAVHPDKRGYIGAEQPRILERLGIDPDRFVRQSGHLPRSFGSAIGTAASLVDLSARREKKYQRGIGVARTLFGRKQAA